MTEQHDSLGLATRLEQMQAFESDGWTESVKMLDCRSQSLFSLAMTPHEVSRSSGVVVCPSLFELAKLQKSEIRTMRRMVADGYPAIYVQPQGTGDSTGEPGSDSIDARIDAALAGWERLRALVPSLENVFFLGARLGGAVAVAASERVEGAGLVLWDPVFDGQRYWKQVLRVARITAVSGRQRSFFDPAKEVESSGRAAVFGQMVSRDTLKGLLALNGASVEHRVTGPIFAVALNDDDASTVRQRFTDGDLETVSLGRPAGAHLGVRDAPEAIGPTLEWLRKNAL